MAGIVVVGAGIAGLAFSVAAARQGFVVDVFDRKSEPEAPSKLSSNVLAINRSSRTFLEEEGVWALIAEQYKTPFRNMFVKDGSGSGCVSFSADEIGTTELGHIVDQPALRAALTQVAQSFDSLRLNWTSHIDIHNFKQGDVPLLVGADGIYSEIREKFGIQKIAYDYKQTATVCIVKTEEPHNACARQWFLNKGPLAMLPLSNTHEVAVVWSSHESMMGLEDYAFGSELLRASEGDLGCILSVGPRYEFPLRQQHALQYVEEGVALLGDAAHAIHPLAGQGANLGLGDARALITELSVARLEGRALGNLGTLKRFERARQHHNRMTALLMEYFHRLFTNNFLWSMLLRNEALKLFDRNTSLKKFAFGFASK